MVYVVKELNKQCLWYTKNENKREKGNKNNVFY